MPRDPKRQARAGCGARLTAILVAAGAAYGCSSARSWSEPGSLGSRRALLSSLVAVAGPLVASNEARAFQNAVYQYDRSINDAKKPGPQPTDLGVLQRDYLQNYVQSLDRSGAVTKVEGEGILKECGPPANCFSTTFTDYVDTGLHDLKPWRFKGKTPDQAMQDVADVVAEYPPGRGVVQFVFFFLLPPGADSRQQGIDGGGFAVKGTQETYLYVQYESLKRGHRDDVEFAVIPGTPKDAKEGGLLAGRDVSKGKFRSVAASGAFRRPEEVSKDVRERPE
eukprot:s5542_g2.t1